MSRIERDRLADLDDDIDQTRQSNEAPFLGDLAQTVTVSTYPTSASSYFACQPLLVDGAESEGASASFTPDPARTYYAFNIGTLIPPVGTRVIVHDVGGRWVFRYDG